VFFPLLQLTACRKIIACFKGQINSMKAKKQGKAAPSSAKAPELLKALDHTTPSAELPVKFLSLSSSGAADLPAPTTTRMYKQGSFASHHTGSSTGIPVGPMTGPAHSIMPWAESDESSNRGDQGEHFPVPPTAASLAAAAAVAQQQGALYRDSNSFRQWAASAVHTQGLSLRLPVPVASTTARLSLTLASLLTSPPACFARCYHAA